MVSGQPIVCLASIDWDFNWQGPQELMSRFAAAGHPVLFVENTGVRRPRWSDWPRLRKRLQDWGKGVAGIRREQKLDVFAPLLCPLPYSKVAQVVNRQFALGSIRRWVRQQESGRPLLWTFLPTALTLEVIHEVNPELVVYYCVADFEQLGPSDKVKRAETRLLRRADVVVAQCEALAQRCQRTHEQEIPILPYGVNVARFQDGWSASIPPDLQHLQGPIIGYVGAVQRHVDDPLLQALAARNPGWNIVVVGPYDSTLARKWCDTNIHLLDAKTHSEIPHYIAAFDVCLIPYQLNAYTQTVFPTKLNEYLILGKPVISTPLPEVLAFNQRHGAIVAIADTPATFEARIHEALGEARHARQQRAAIARQYDWATHFETLNHIVATRACLPQ